MLADTVGIERGRLTDGTVVVRLADGGQGLNHQPGRVVGIFHRELTLRHTSREQLRQVDSLRARLVLRKRYGDGNTFTVGQDGQVVLLAVAEAVASGHHLGYKQ